MSVLDFMDAKGILINGWSDLKDAFLDLINATWWIVVLIISLPFLYLMVDENEIRILEIFMKISKPILIALMAMFAFKVLLRRKEIKVEITTSKFLVYMLASFFVGMAVCATQSWRRTVRYCWPVSRLDAISTQTSPPLSLGLCLRPVR